MKKRRFIILGVILLIICFVSAGTLVWYLCDGRYIKFADEVIRTSALYAVNKDPNGNGKILKTQIEEIESFRIRNGSLRGVKTLEDLTKFPNLVVTGTWLNEYYDAGSEKEEVDSLYPELTDEVYKRYTEQLYKVLPKLDQLKKVVLCSFTIMYDMDAFSKSDQVEEVWIVRNRIKDISGIAGMKNLRILDLSYNEFTDISALSGLDNLEALSLWGNDIENLEVLLDIPTLKAVIYDPKDEKQEAVLQQLSERGCCVVREERKLPYVLRDIGIEHVKVYL